MPKLSSDAKKIAQIVAKNIIVPVAVCVVVVTVMNKDK